MSHQPPEIVDAIRARQFVEFVDDLTRALRERLDATVESVDEQGLIVLDHQGARFRIDIAIEGS